MSKKDEKYNPTNWETWKPILEKYHSADYPFSKCDYCEFSMPDTENEIMVCAATYNGENLQLITSDMLNDCDFELSFYTYCDIGEKGIDKDFSAYVKSPY